MPKSPEGRFPQERSSEKERRKSGIGKYVERMLEGDTKLTADEKEDLETGVGALSSEQKAVEVYEYVIANVLSHGSSSESGFSDYGRERLKTLWGDKEAQDIFLDRYTTARMEAKVQRTAELAKEIRDLSTTIERKQDTLEKLDQELNLESDTFSEKQLKDRRARRGDISRTLKDLVTKRQEAITLEGREPTPENADVSAMVMYEQLQEYRKQNDKEHFVWFPSRKEISDDIDKYSRGGKTSLLLGPSGTGKTTIFKAKARALTGKDGVVIGCEQSMSTEGLIYKLDLKAGEGAHNYRGTVTEALTGYLNSQDAVPTYHHGRGVLLDEVNELNYNKVKGPLKVIKGVQPGDMLDGKPVLQGGFVAAAANYPITEEALAREFARIPVDYLKMTKDNPELYEFFIVTLMRKGGHLPAVPRSYLEPFYEAVEMPEEERKKVFSDQSITRAIGEKLAPIVRSGAGGGAEIDSRHGFLYRLAYAVRAVQDSYIRGSKFNEKHMANTAVYVGVDDQGNTIVKGYQPDISLPDPGFGGEKAELTTGGSTIEARLIESWFKNYESPGSFAAHIQAELQKHIDQVTEDNDRKLLKAIFDYFHLFDERLEGVDPSPLTPLEIGYLSPRVPRPWKLEKPAVATEEALPGADKISGRIEISDAETIPSEGGGQIKFLKESFRLPDGEEVKVGQGLVLGGENYVYLGIAPERSNAPVVSPEEGKLGRIIENVEELEYGILENYDDEQETTLEGYTEITKNCWEQNCQGESAPSW